VLAPLLALLLLSPSPIPHSPSPIQDVAQTSQGELRLTPLAGDAIYLAWAGRSIYIDPHSADRFRHSPKADLILFGSPAAIAVLRKATTVTVGPVLQPRTATLPGEGKPVQVQLFGIGPTGILLQLGNARVLFTGPSGCTPAALQQGHVAIAFVAVTSTPQATAACIERMRPKIVYPYLAQGDGAQRVADLLKKSGIQVRLRDWHQ